MVVTIQVQWKIKLCILTLGWTMVDNYHCQDNDHATDSYIITAVDVIRILPSDYHHNIKTWECTYTHTQLM